MDNLEYLSDPRFVSNQESDSLINAARIIIKDFKDLIDYVEPVDANKSVFSHRIYELLLRTATEFEANCKGILLANNYTASTKDHYTINDYYKINQIMELDKYIVSTQLWNPEKKFSPLSQWALNASLDWYKAYNKVKHNRYSNFQAASLDNLFTGICSLVVILAAQFPNKIGQIGASGLTAILSVNEIIVGDFTIQYPQFNDHKLYQFNWEVIKTEEQAFDKYVFN